ncbi:hypothetical protein GSI_12225 [Ganoderma sinense ZZ0214-1]|uniref:Uncharacterized protein n=1 Tax=Ganoderma sinense ZZ0214-1 TaxID=1077348 RepID=A0A2G8RYA7_9APHY|nr:hypothetical protein GSI_12225 [Ganoderma sinense ZZ0214-1]
MSVADVTAHTELRKQQISVTRIQCIGAVNLARLTDTPPTPLALYECCMLRDGWTHEAGMVEHLGAEDMKRCFGASITLRQERQLVLCGIFYPAPPQRCRDRGFCAQDISDAADSVMRVQDMATKELLWDWMSWGLDPGPRGRVWRVQGGPARAGPGGAQEDFGGAATDT